MSAQHTPGPWFIWKELAMRKEGLEPDEIEFELLQQADHCIYAGEPVECTRGRLKGHTAYICNVDADDYDFDDDEDVSRATALSNARLIAAAPDLLAALQTFPGFTDNATVGDAWVETMRAAIAKATGSQS